MAHCPPRALHRAPPPLLLLLLLLLLMCCARTALCDSSSSSGSARSPFAASVLYEMPFVNFTFRSANETDTYFGSGAFRSAMIAGVKVLRVGSAQQIFVSVPRWKAGVPATLNRIVAPNPYSPDPQSCLLEPYPSWEMNRVGDPTALQSVLGFEIDFASRLWVIDQGRVDNQPAIHGSIKLIVWDLINNVSLRTYVFADNEASPFTSFLNDIVVDQASMFAYISDSGIPLNDTYPNPLAPAIIAYDYNADRAHRWLGDTQFVQPSPGFQLQINGQYVFSASNPMRTGADGIALTCDGATLFFCALSSHMLYAVPTSYLRDFNKPESVVDAAVDVQGMRDFASDGLIAGADGALYLTSLEQSGVKIWTVAAQQLYTPSPTSQISTDFLVSSPSTMMWPDTMAFDHAGNLLFVSNQLQNFVAGAVPTADTSPSAPPVFRIWRIELSAYSYLHGCTGPLPWVIGIMSLTVALAFIVIVVVIVIAVRLSRRSRTVRTVVAHDLPTFDEVTPLKSPLSDDSSS